ncbi:MAG TPA: VIT1/CCC1 transporter family protein [Nitrososphaerales archaeon]|nr:VIT1/CCC1 transporter family protein [Nitrososphaerales archaeon]
MDSQSGLRQKAATTQQEKHPHIPARHLIDRIVLGGSDGAIEAVAMTAALNGAGVGFSTIVLAGFAFAVAGAVSMFFSTFLSRRSELASLRIDIEREKMEIETEPEEESAELEGLLKKDGYGEKEVEVIMARLRKDKGLWLREQLARELRVHVEDLSSDSISRPAMAGLAFFVLAILAILPYALPISHVNALGVSILVSLVALFALGSRAMTPSNFRISLGLESAVVGGVAAALMYLLGIAVSYL